MSLVNIAGEKKKQEAQRHADTCAARRAAAETADTSGRYAHEHAGHITLRRATEATDMEEREKEATAGHGQGGKKEERKAIYQHFQSHPLPAACPGVLPLSTTPRSPQPPIPTPTSSNHPSSCSLAINSPSGILRPLPLSHITPSLFLSCVPRCLPPAPPVLCGAQRVSF
jgi:hypothetical protein